MNKATTLVWYTRTPKGWRRFPVIQDKDRIKKGWVMEKGVLTHYPDGKFQIRQYDGSRLVYSPVATDDPVQAMYERKRRQRQLLIKGKVEDNKKVLRNAARDYVKDLKTQHRFEAAQQAEVVLREFQPIAKTSYVAGVTRQHVLAYHQHLRKKGMSDRTIFNKHNRLRSFMKFTGASKDIMKMMGEIMPSFERKNPTIYTGDELKTILEAADPYERLMLEMGLKLGLRDQELTYAEWADIDWSGSVFRVQGKIHWDFKVKDSEQRDIPIPADLLERLTQWRALQPKTRLILPTKNNKPNVKMLTRLKTLARSAGLNCGTCVSCKGKNKECRLWTLHKLRRSYVTTLLRKGVDLATTQKFVGHSDLASTTRYLNAATAPEMQGKINAIDWF